MDYVFSIYQAVTEHWGYAIPVFNFGFRKILVWNSLKKNPFKKCSVWENSSNSSKDYENLFVTANISENIQTWLGFYFFAVDWPLGLQKSNT